MLVKSKNYFFWGPGKHLYIRICTYLYIFCHCSLLLVVLLTFNFSFILFLSRNTHSCMRSKRLRTTEEPVVLDGSSVLGSTKKSLGGSSGSKARKSAVRSTCREIEKEKEANSKHRQFSGKNLCDWYVKMLRKLWACSLI